MRKAQMSERTIKIILLAVMIVLICVLLIRFGIVNIIKNVFPSFDASSTEAARVANQQFNPAIWQDARCPQVIGYIGVETSPSKGFFLVNWFSNNFRTVYLDKKETKIKIYNWNDPEKVYSVLKEKQIGTIMDRHISIYGGDLGIEDAKQIDGSWIYPEVNLDEGERIIPLCKNA